MATPLKYLAQAALYALFFVPLVFVTHNPTHRHLDDNLSVLKIAVRHSGQIIGECETLSAGDYAKLAANMKQLESCPRERSPLQLELRVDGETLYSGTTPASGIHNDGLSSMYRRFTLPSGRHRLQIFMNDDVAVEGYTWELDQDIELRPAQVMVARFKEGIVLH